MAAIAIGKPSSAYSHQVRRKHSQPSNDDLLYDPDMDNEDQHWVDEQRQRQHGSSSSQSASAGQQGGARDKRGKKSNSSVPTSDAVLDCPACMSTLCIDCQR
jgi:hypothetical protein